jgi:hypothetical protein
VLKTDVSGEIDDLVNSTSADLVMVWAIDLPRNTADFVDARQRGGGVFRFSADQLPAVGATSKPEAVARLLDGEPWCDGISHRGSPFGDEMTAAGFRAMCVVPVPPGQRALLVGIIVLAWRNPPNPNYQAAAVAAARRDAGRMVMR